MKIRLEPLAERHHAALRELVDDPDSLRFTRIPEPPPPGFVESWVARYEAGRHDGTSEGFAAVGPGGELLGVGLAPTIDREGSELELGYIVSPGARGRGVATEILRRLTDWAFDELGALRIWLVIDSENHASKRVAEHCGYVREGVMRSSHLKQGRRADAEIWAQLAGERR